MKVSKSSIYNRKRCSAEVKFEAEGGQLTAYSGLIVFASLFGRLGLKSKIAAACPDLGGRLYTKASIFLWLIVHVLLGCARLRDSDKYRSDPMVLKVLGMDLLPSVPTATRVLREFTEDDIGALGELSSKIVTDRLLACGCATLTLDFDGTVLSTSRHAEGSAVGFNKQKKGARSYYPLACVVSQSGQVFDMLHRSGNVHDSNGAAAFVKSCVERAWERVPGARVEVRLDSAFFSDEMITLLEELGVEYTISVPFERFTELKRHIENRDYWWPGSGGASSFEKEWKPNSWDTSRRFVYVRQKVAKQRKGTLQLDLFEPIESSYDYKVVVTNKTGTRGNVVRYHEGRGSQEATYGQLKNSCAMGYIPCKSWAANKVFLLANVVAHNLSRDLQMESRNPDRATEPKRPARWVFETLTTLQNKLISRPGKMTRPQGALTLTVPKDPVLESYFNTGVANICYHVCYLIVGYFRKSASAYIQLAGTP